MLNKKYITRTDLKVAGFSNLEFTVNRPESKVHLTADYTFDNGKVKYKILFEVETELESKVHLTADYTNEIGKVKYKILFEVETELERTSQKSIEKLCRMMLEKLVLFQTLKQSEQKKFALENGYVVA